MGCWIVLYTRWSWVIYYILYIFLFHFVVEIWACLFVQRNKCINSLQHNILIYLSTKFSVDTAHKLQIDA